MSDEILEQVVQAATVLLRELESVATQLAETPIFKDAKLRVFAAIDSCLGSLAATGVVGPENRLPSSKWWEMAGEILSRGELQLRARTKPLGYAGDYVMLTQIYNRYACADALGNLFDQYFQALDAPEAVRQRIDLAAAELQTHCSAAAASNYRIAVVGAGPAIELEIALRAGAKPSEVLLLDLDEAALDEARQRLASVENWQGNLTLQRENLYRLPGRADRTLPGDSVDFLICLGLFDYLADNDAVAHLQTHWRALRTGGQMLVGNFSVESRSRAYMEWIGNWYLIFRSPTDLARLATTAGIPPDSFHVTASANGVNLLLRATKR